MVTPFDYESKAANAEEDNRDVVVNDEKGEREGGSGSGENSDVGDQIRDEDHLTPNLPINHHINSPSHFGTYLQQASIQRQLENEGMDVTDDGEGFGLDAANRGATTITEKENINARRALRTATWAGVFFLITTDIIGPGNAPFAISLLGYVPGILLFVFLGIIAFYCSCLIAYLFNALDSPLYPIHNYSHIAERTLGSSSKYIIHILQSTQLVFGVAIVLLTNAQSLYQMSKGKICFVVAIVIFTVIGMLVDQIRTLRSFSWFAYLAVFSTMIIVFTSMGFIAHSVPNYDSAAAAFGVMPGPVMTFAFVTNPLYARITGMLQMVYAYGGGCEELIDFPEIMAEMRRPMDFYKAMACSQLFIGFIYLLYGIFVYSKQGQFTLPVAWQGVSVYSWQTVGNSFSLFSGVIAAGLYGNIGLKIVYREIVEGWFKGPMLLSKKGRFVWSGLVVIYWTFAFILCAAIPQIAALGAFISALAGLQFTYVLPPLMFVAFLWRKADLEKRTNEIYGSPPLSTLNHLLLLSFNSILVIAGLATVGLSLWASGSTIKQTFAAGAATSFSCTAPV